MFAEDNDADSSGEFVPIDDPSPLTGVGNVIFEFGGNARWGVSISGAGGSTSIEVVSSGPY